MIVNKCVFIGSGQAVLAYCYEMEEDIESKGNKLEIKKETEKYCKALLNASVDTHFQADTFFTTHNIDFAEGHPSQPDLPPEA
ncbi:MAG: hypothetical protein ACK5B3_01085 [Bacteroidota bacterium]|jgi:hypothetical protein